MEFSLTPSERHTLLVVARNAIRERLGLPPLSEAPGPTTPALQRPCGAFVTLHKQGMLRGCIGHITASLPLIETVREMAVSSALHDPRFPPVVRSEVDELHLEISVLSPFRRITDPREIEVGVHGILLRAGHHSGLLLPQVATEQGWDRDTFLDHTCMKAGLPPGTWREAGTEIEVFSAIVFSEEP